VNFSDEYARPFSDGHRDLLGVPPEDHEEFRAVFSGKVVGVSRTTRLTVAHNPLEYLNDKFSAYITERVFNHEPMLLTELAMAKYPDGSTPDVTTSCGSRPSSSRPARKPPRSYSASGCG